MTPRVSAHALVTDPAGRALLIRVHDDSPLDASDPVTDYWITVGGGVEAGESIEQALIREVFEETGQRIDRAGPCIWRRRATLVDPLGVRRDFDEHYFHCVLSSTELSDAHLTDLERTVIREFRWWDLSDPELARARIFPEAFAAAARAVLAGGPPDEPLWLD